MLTPLCVCLSTLASILREEYRRKTALAAENANPKNLAEVEANIVRANKLLFEHPEYCSLCAASEREVGLQCGARKPVNSERDCFRLDMAS